MIQITGKINYTLKVLFMMNLLLNYARRFDTHENVYLCRLNIYFKLTSILKVRCPLLIVNVYNMYSFSRSEVTMGRHSTALLAAGLVALMNVTAGFQFMINASMY